MLPPSLRVRCRGRHGHALCLSPPPGRVQTEGFVIDTSGLLKSYANTTSPLVGQLDASLLKQPTREVNGQVRPWLQIEGEPLIYPFASDGGSYDPATVDQNTAYFEAEAGITIYELIDALEKNNLGLVNMGGAAWQTLAGYASTSTHGSGINFGPVADGIKSLVLITTGEWPAEKGLTVPAKAGSLGAGERGRHAASTAPPPAQLHLQPRSRAVVARRALAPAAHARVQKKKLDLPHTPRKKNSIPSHTHKKKLDLPHTPCFARTCHPSLQDKTLLPSKARPSLPSKARPSRSGRSETPRARSEPHLPRLPCLLCRTSHASPASLATGGVWAYRIEPSSGITDPQAYAASSAAETVGLIQVAARSPTPARPHPLAHARSPTPACPRLLAHARSPTPARLRLLAFARSPTLASPRPLAHTCSPTPARLRACGSLACARVRACVCVLRASEGVRACGCVRAGAGACECVRVRVCWGVSGVRCLEFVSV